jgi:small-conductance mechanosensitive channel
VDGVTNVRGQVLLALWDAFKREGIEIPYPVRDVRITQAAVETGDKKEANSARA